MNTILDERHTHTEYRDTHTKYSHTQNTIILLCMIQVEFLVVSFYGGSRKRRKVSNQMK